MILSLQETWRDGAARLREAGCDTPLLDARLLIQHVTGYSYEQFILHAKDVLPPEPEARFSALLARRAAREPISHLLGWREFYGRRYQVTPDVLTPRPDSETLIDAALAHQPDRARSVRVLDLGTGTGCLLLTLLAEWPQASGEGVDVSPAALAVAQANAKSLNLADRADFQQGRWCEGLGDKKFEIVVANPPYIPSNAVHVLMPEVARFEPHLALDGGEDGLACYRVIAESLPKHLTQEAKVIVEIGQGQQHEVTRLFEAQGFACLETRADLAGISRALVFRHGA